MNVRVSVAVSCTWMATISTSRSRYRSATRASAVDSLPHGLQYEAWKRSTMIFLPISSLESIVRPSRVLSRKPGAAGAACATPASATSTASAKIRRGMTL